MKKKYGLSIAKGFLLIAVFVTLSGCLGNSEAKRLSLNGKKGTLYQTKIDVYLDVPNPHYKRYRGNVDYEAGVSPEHFPEKPLLAKGSTLELERIEVNEFYWHRTFFPFFAPKMYHASYVFKKRGKNQTIFWGNCPLLEASRTPDPAKQEEDFFTLFNSRMAEQVAPVSGSCIRK